MDANGRKRALFSIEKVICYKWYSNLQAAACFCLYNISPAAAEIIWPLAVLDFQSALAMDVSRSLTASSAIRVQIISRVVFRRPLFLLDFFAKRRL